MDIKNNDTKNFIITGGPFLVNTNEYGAIITNYGWSKLQIIENIEIYIICEYNGKNIIIDTFILENPINKYNYELICLHFKNGFGSKYSFQFAKKNNFITKCKERLIHFTNTYK
jgi:hypothetical protein